MLDAAVGVTAAEDRRTTRTNFTADLRSSDPAPARPSLLDQCQRLFAEYSRPTQNAFAFKPLARHSATRFAHSFAFAMSTKMGSAASARYTAS
jgi:hypothetical protein